MKKFANILLIVLLVVTVALTGYAVLSSPEVEAAISLNLLWGYFLFAVAVIAAVCCALHGMVQSPKGLVASLLSMVAIIAIVAISYFVSAGHNIQIVNLDTGGFFGHTETVIAETSIWVAYVAGAGAIIAAIYSEIANAFK